MERLKQQQPIFSKHLIIHYLKKFEKLDFFFSVKETNPSTGKEHIIYSLHWWWNIIKKCWSSNLSFKGSYEWKMDIICDLDFCFEDLQDWKERKRS